MLSSLYPLLTSAEMSHYTRQPRATIRERQMWWRGGGAILGSYLAWTGKLGLPEIITGSGRNHNHIILIILEYCLTHSFPFPLAETVELCNRLDIEADVRSNHLPLNQTPGRLEVMQNCDPSLTCYFIMYLHNKNNLLTYTHHIV